MRATGWPLSGTASYRELRDLSRRVGPGIFSERDQPIDRPALDVVSRPSLLRVSHRDP